jgi:hypothetical protein
VRGCDLSADAYSDAAEPSKLKRKRNPDTELHLDNEEDTLYNDRLELEDDTPPMGTAGRRDDNARWQVGGDLRMTPAKYQRGRADGYAGCHDDSDRHRGDGR